MNDKHGKLVDYVMIENDKSCREKRKGEVRGEEEREGEEEKGGEEGRKGRRRRGGEGRSGGRRGVGGVGREENREAWKQKEERIREQDKRKIVSRCNKQKK